MKFYSLWTFVWNQSFHDDSPKLTVLKNISYINCQIITNLIDNYIGLKIDILVFLYVIFFIFNDKTKFHKLMFFLCLFISRNVNIFDVKITVFLITSGTKIVFKTISDNCFYQVSVNYFKGNSKKKLIVQNRLHKL